MKQTAKNTAGVKAEPKKDEAKANASDKPKQTRKMLTPAERVAKLEQDLAEARVKAQGKDRKAFDVVVEKITALTAKKDSIEKQLEELAGERDAIVARVPELVNESSHSEL